MPQGSIAISVIVNAHREGGILASALRSANEAVEEARRWDVSVEDVILVLDRPDSDTCRTASTFPGIEVVETDVGDLGLARNAGIQVARGTHVALLDGDDAWGRSWLYRAATFLQSSPDGDVILHPELNLYFGRDEPYFVRHRSMAAASSESLVLGVDNCWTSLMFASIEVCRRIPFRPVDRERGFGFEDWSFYRETLAAGISHQVVPQTVHFIRRKEAGSLLDHVVQLNLAPWPTPELYARR